MFLCVPCGKLYEAVVSVRSLLPLCHYFSAVVSAAAPPAAVVSDELLEEPPHAARESATAQRRAAPANLFFILHLPFFFLYSAPMEQNIHACSHMPLGTNVKGKYFCPWIWYYFTAINQFVAQKKFSCTFQQIFLLWTYTWKSCNFCLYHHSSTKSLLGIYSVYYGSKLMSINWCGESRGIPLIFRTAQPAAGDPVCII